MNVKDARIQVLEEQNKFLLRQNKQFREEARRCRKLTKAILKGMNTAGALTEITYDAEDARFNIVVCAPGLNEHKLGPAVSEIAKSIFHGKLEVGKVEVTGTEAEDGEQDPL